MAFWEIEPWGEATSTWQIASLCALVANLPRSITGGRGRDAKPEEFMYGKKPPKPHDITGDPKRIFATLDSLVKRKGARRGSHGQGNGHPQGQAARAAASGA